MARPPAPSIPTPTQVRDVHKTVLALHPDARIKSVGPEGITFEYPGAIDAGGTDWRDVPFFG